MRTTGPTACSSLLTPAVATEGDLEFAGANTDRGFMAFSSFISKVTASALPQFYVTELPHFTLLLLSKTCAVLSISLSILPLYPKISFRSGAGVTPGDQCGL